MARSQGVLIPSIQYEDLANIDPLIETIAECWNSKTQVNFDFSKCSYLGANGISVLAALFEFRKSKRLRTTILKDTASKKLQDTLQKFGFLELFDATKKIETTDSMPIFRTCNTNDELKLIDYLDEQLIKKADFLPQMNDFLAKEIKRSFCELLTNVIQHARSPIGGIFTGQFQRFQKEFQICICDRGLGISERVKMSNENIHSTEEALSWALEKGNSTKDTGNPSGLGLHLLRNFVNVNGGEFRLYANDGVLSERAGSQKTYPLKAPYPGTLIEVRLKVRDDVKYVLV